MNASTYSMRKSIKEETPVPQAERSTQFDASPGKSFAKTIQQYKQQINNMRNYLTELEDRKYTPTLSLHSTQQQPVMV